MRGQLHRYRTRRLTETFNFTAPGSAGDIPGTPVNTVTCAFLITTGGAAVAAGLTCSENG